MATPNARPRAALTKILAGVVTLAAIAGVSPALASERMGIHGAGRVQFLDPNYTGLWDVNADGKHDSAVLTVTGDFDPVNGGEADVHVVLRLGANQGWTLAHVDAECRRVNYLNTVGIGLVTGVSFECGASYEGTFGRMIFESGTTIGFDFSAGNVVARLSTSSYPAELNACTPGAVHPVFTGCYPPFTLGMPLVVGSIALH